MITTIAITYNCNIQQADSFQKIYDAGYDPLHLCYIQGDQIIRVEASEINT